MGAEIVQNDQEILHRIFFSDPAEEGTNILLPGVFVEFHHRSSVERIEPEGVGPQLGGVLRDERLSEGPKLLAVRGGLGRGLVQESDDGVTGYSVEFFLRRSSASAGRRWSRGKGFA